MDPSAPFYFSFFGCAMCHVGSYFPSQGANLSSLDWKLGGLTTGPSGKSPQQFLFFFFFLNNFFLLKIICLMVSLSLF